jgi:hypothetical protein
MPSCRPPMGCRTTAPGMCRRRPKTGQFRRSRSERSGQSRDCCSALLLGRVSMPRSLSRYEAPLRAMTSAWWTMRSIISAATTWSAKTAAQELNGRFEVRVSEACSYRENTS